MLLLEHSAMPSVFQFHKGTIKTLITMLNISKRIINFNSIKVRLKHLVDQIKIGVEGLFQFHKGTIKT